MGPLAFFLRSAFVRARLLPLAVIAGTFVVAGCSRLSRPLAAPGDVDIIKPPASVTIFFVDGIDRQRMDELLRAGELPNIHRQFVAGGVGVRSGVACMPAVTYPNSVSIITGLFPGHHGVLGNRWFDRSSCLLRDYGLASTYRGANDDFAAPTLYDLLADELTVNVQGHTRRGVDVSIDNWAASGIDWYLENYSDTDARVGECFSKVAAAARTAGRWPVIYFNYFPGVDEIGHHEGSDSAGYAQALRTADAAIGRIIADVEAAQIAERRYYVLLSDHGHVPLDPTHHIDLQGWLESTHGRRVRVERCQTGGQAGRCRVMAGYDTVLDTGASRRAAIHLRGPEGWSAPASTTDIDALIDGGLAALPGVALVCTRDGADAVRVVSRDGEARIERRRGEHGEKHYRLAADAAQPADVLGYQTDPQLAAFIAAGWHDSRAWLAATARATCPDFVPQVVEMFDSPRAGDIVVFAASHATFESEVLGGHGSCFAGDMIIPLYFSGPGLPAGGTVAAGRLVDVMPTVLELLGVAERLDSAALLDGISLLPQLRTAQPAD